MQQPVTDNPQILAYFEHLRGEAKTATDGLRAAVVAERQLRQTAEAERDAAKSAAEAAKTAADAETAKLRTAADRWAAHEADLAAKRTEANAAALARLPEASRAAISGLGLDDVKLAALLAAIPAQADPTSQAATPPPTPATPPPAGQQPPAAPSIPAGGAVPGQQPSDRPAPEIERWIAEKRRDLIGVSKAAAEAAYNAYGPGAKTPKA